MVGKGDAAEAPLCGLVGVVFDMDGTLTLDGAIDFDAMRKEVGVPDERGILEYVHSLPAEARESGEEIIRRIEREGYERMDLNDACVETVHALKSAGLKIGILTRNTDEAVQYFLDRFGLRGCFDVTLSREWEGPPKPAPDALLHIRGMWMCEPRQMLMVGDHLDDVLTGKAADCHTALLRLEKNKEHHVHTDHSINGLWELVSLHGGPKREE